VRSSGFSYQGRTLAQSHACPMPRGRAPRRQSCSLETRSPTPSGFLRTPTVQPPRQPHLRASTSPAKLKVGVTHYPPSGARLVPLFVGLREPEGRLARADPNAGRDLRIKPSVFRTNPSTPHVEEAVQRSPSAVQVSRWLVSRA
jgi:hypothetical protein